MIKQFRAYLSSLISFSGKRGLGLLCLMFLAAMLEGMGLFILVPVLEVFAGDPTSRIAYHLQSFLVQAGLASKTQQLVAMLSIFLILFLARSLVVWLRDIRLMTLNAEFIDHWRGRLFAALSNAPWSVASQSSRSEVEYSIMSDVARLELGTDRILRGTVSLFVLAAQIAIAFILSPLLTAMVLVFVSITALLFLPTVKRAESMGHVLSRTGRNAHKALGDFFSGLKLAKAHNSEGLYARQFREQIGDLRKSRLQFLNEHGFLRGAFEFASAVLICIIIAVGLLVLETPLPLLLVFLLIMRRLTGPFFQLIQSAQSFANMIPAFVHVQKIETDLRRDTLSIAPGTSSQPVATLDRDARFEITFDAVSYRHAGASADTFSDVNLTIEMGTIVEINGPSGAGKTTFIDLLLGLLHPGSGQIKYNGIATTDGATKPKTAYVAQDPFLFDLTLRENLLWPNSTCDDARIWDCLEATNIAHKIRTLPDLLDSKTGERGSLLSGGERQRVCLARALLQDPSLLILDEATNAVDLKSEQILFEMLKSLRGNMTILIVSRRAPEQLEPDNAITVKEGRVTMSKRTTP